MCFQTIIFYNGGCDYLSDKNESDRGNNILFHIKIYYIQKIQKKKKKKKKKKTKIKKEINTPKIKYCNYCYCQHYYYYNAQIKPKYYIKLEVKNMLPLSF